MDDLIERLAAAHDHFAALDGVDNHDLVAVLDAAALATALAARDERAAKNARAEAERIALEYFDPSDNWFEQFCDDVELAIKDTGE